MSALNTQAYTHLKEMILRNELNAHEIYSETKLSKDLGISRTPCRDAIHKLVQEGYLDIIPSKGFQLHQLSETDIINTFQVRTALETYCTMELTKHYSDPSVQKLFQHLEKTITHMKKIINSSRSIEAFKKYDLDFHKMIIGYFNNEQLKNIYESNFYRISRLATLSLGHEGRMENTCKEHENILNAMRSGDVSLVYEVTLVHMDRARIININDIGSY